MSDLTFALETSTGLGLDQHGERLLLPRRSAESDDYYRSRLRLWVGLCTCRRGVHVLSHDSSTWSHCQCGQIRTDDAKPRQAAQVVARDVGVARRVSDYGDVTITKGLSVPCPVCQWLSACAEGKAGYVKCAACQQESAFFDRQLEDVSTNQHPNPPKMLNDEKRIERSIPYGRLVTVDATHRPRIFRVALVDNPPNPQTRLRLTPATRPDGFSQERVDEIKSMLMSGGKK